MRPLQVSDVNYPHVMVSMASFDTLTGSLTFAVVPGDNAPAESEVHTAKVINIPSTVSGSDIFVFVNGDKFDDFVLQAQDDTFNYLVLKLTGWKSSEDYVATTVNVVLQQ
jgi:hypothetical protein